MVRKRSDAHGWVALPDEELLDLRLCDLGLRIEGTELEPRIERLRDELHQAGQRFRPHFWLSSDWFSPGGVPGVAIPFFLAHPRLTDLERTQMLEVEGGTEEWCMKILRHETGHAIDTAYRLHRRKSWRSMFGRFSDPYEPFYQPKPYSRRFVLHLDSWYAQSHPAEDFAETFAVWLTPGSQWRSRYAKWPALRKLEYVDQVMEEVATQPAVVRCREQTERVSTLRTTLRQYYRRKKEHYGDPVPEFYDRDLRKLFQPRRPADGRQQASAFLRSVRPRIRRRVARWTGEFQYTIDQVIKEMIAQTDKLDLVVEGEPAEVEQDLQVMLTVQTMNYLHSGYHRLAR
jgi:hypothetical protein